MIDQKHIEIFIGELKQLFLNLKNRATFEPTHFLNYLNPF